MSKKWVSEENLPISTIMSIKSMANYINFRVKGDRPLRNRHFGLVENRGISSSLVSEAVHVIVRYSSGYWDTQLLMNGFTEGSVEIPEAVGSIRGTDKGFDIREMVCLNSLAVLGEGHIGVLKVSEEVNEIWIDGSIDVEKIELLGENSGQRLIAHLMKNVPVVGERKFFWKQIGYQGIEMTNIPEKVATRVLSDAKHHGGVEGVMMRYIDGNEVELFKDNEFIGTAKMGGAFIRGVTEYSLKNN